MPPDDGQGDRALVVQLARLGDLVQSLPAIEALRQRDPGTTIDAVCAAPLVPVLRACPIVRQALPWDGAQWVALADRWEAQPDEILESAGAWLRGLTERPYDQVYNLNQHVRSILVAHLLGRRVIGAGAEVFARRRS
jgi:heptosyltransferase-1